MSAPTQQLIIDRFLGLTRHEVRDSPTEPGLISKLQGHARTARRFVLTPQASGRLGEVVRDIPELLVREHQFARAPFDRCWIEFAHVPYWTALTGKPPDDEIDLRLAYFIDHDTVYVITGGSFTEPDTTHLGLCRYYLHTPWELDDKLRFAAKHETSRMQLDAFLLGSTWDKLDRDQRRDVAGAHSFDMLPLNPRARSTWTPAQLAAAVLESSSGELRNILALLLMLNRPSITTYTDAPASRHFSKGKLRQYLSHTVVDITTDPRPILRRLGTPAEAGTQKRRHEVRGFWRHNRAYHAATKAGCVHDWLADPVLGDEWHYICRSCEGRRVWVKAHARGNALIGFVAHDGYNVDERSSESSVA